MSEYEPIYRQPELKLLMSELIARQGVAETVEVVFSDEVLESDEQ